MKQILIVDDDPKISRGLSVRLKFAGYEVRTAENGVTGLKLALEFKPDLVILDIMMPVGGGYSVAYRLREQAPELPVIFITASKQPQLREMAAKLDAVGFFEKPYEFEEVLTAIKAAIKSEPWRKATPEPPPRPKPVPNRIAAADSPTPVRRPDAPGNPLSRPWQNEIIKSRGNLNPPSRPARHDAGPEAGQRIGKQVTKALAAALSLVADPPQRLRTESPASALPAPEPLHVELPAPRIPENAPDLRLANLGTAASSRTPAKSQPALAGITGRNRILIVEDDRRIAMALTLRLQNAGYEVCQAFEAMTGVEAAIKHPPDLILMDISLPGGSGLIAAQKIQSLVPKLIPMIFLTASKQPGLRQKALALGAAGFLEKPYNPVHLLTTIQNALLAAVDKDPGSSTPAPTAPENALDLRLANLKMAAPSRIGAKSQPELAGITGRNKILIVEDDRRIAMDLTLRLQKAGQEVIQASDAMSGMTATTQHQPDLILIDINLPGGSGLIMAQSIQSVVPKLTPIIFLTASQQPGLRQKPLALGAAGFLDKPYSSADLIAAIQDALSLGRGDDPTANEGFSL
jgi:DNA-binding response OmpR family regulator